MPKMRKQIISPHVRFAASSRGPYANKLGGGMYAKSFGLREAAASFIAFGEDSAGVIKALVKGQGAVTFERQTTATVETGPDGLIEECLRNEMRHGKGRRVENRINRSGNVNDRKSEDLSTLSGNVQITIDGTDGVIPSAVDTFHYTAAAGPGAIPVNEGATLWLSADAEKAYSNVAYLRAQFTTDGATFAGAATAFFNIDTLTFGTADGITDQGYTDLGNGKVRIYIQATVPATAFFVDLRCYAVEPDSEDRSFAGDGSTVYIRYDRRMIKDVTGQSNQNPSEYVSVGVVTDHGAFVDGVRYYALSNPYQVDPLTNVVTEDAATTPITDYRTLFEPASTNYTDDSNDLSGGAETVDLTAGGTGDFTLSVSGTAAVTVAAGTATGTGFGQATAGNPVTFNLTSTGTVTLTLDSGSLDTAQGGQAVKQVEPGSTATSFIITDGSPPVTRTADDGSSMFDYANWSQTEGTWFADVWFGEVVLTATQNILSLAATPGPLFKKNGDKLRSSDDGDSTRSQVALPNAAADNQYRCVSDFGTGDTLEVGARDVEGAGSFVWDDTPENYDGAFNSSNQINIAYSISAPMGIRFLTGYKTRKGKQWVEDNK